MVACVGIKRAVKATAFSRHRVSNFSVIPGVESRGCLISEVFVPAGLVTVCG